MSLAQVKLHWPVAIFFEFSFGQLNTETETLYEAKDTQCFGDVRVPVVGDTGCAEVFDRDSSKGTARTGQFNAVVKPVNASGCVRCLIGPMHDCITRELLESRRGVLLRANFPFGR